MRRENREKWEVNGSAEEHFQIPDFEGTRGESKGHQKQARVALKKIWSVRKKFI